MKGNRTVFRAGRHEERMTQVRFAKDEHLLRATWERAA